MAATAAHVLVVDDAAELRDLYQAILESEGYRVTLLAQAPSVGEVGALAPDAVLLDLLLSGDEGAAWGLLAGMRADPRLRALPVVVCSAASELLRRLAPGLAELGAAVLPKPFELDAFSAAVARAVGRPVPG
jgi:CheY-like chemotaxis protein